MPIVTAALINTRPARLASSDALFTVFEVFLCLVDIHITIANIMLFVNLVSCSSELLHVDFDWLTGFQLMERNPLLA